MIEPATCRYCVLLLATFLSLLAAPQVPARAIHYGAVQDPALMECDRLRWHGRIDDARACYASLISGPSTPFVKAEAAWARNDLGAANAWYRRALAESPDDTSARVRWGDLYADSHQNAEAMKIYREVLAVDPQNAFARLGAARVLVDSFEGAAGEYLSQLLADPLIDRGARAAALLLVATTALEAGNRVAALRALDEAEAIIDANAWPPLDIYALRAAAERVVESDGDEWTERALDYNPHFGGIYATPAHFMVINRQYRAAIDLYQKAIDIEPDLARAHEELGINLLRDNQISRARQHLEIAYREDPFSPKAVNTLRLLDSFDNFRVLEDRPAEPGDVPVVLRLHKREADAIAPYAFNLARAGIAEFSGRYDFRLREPVIIEMYPDHDDFAVRTAGMPGLGILGATFGYLVAMDSPSARPPQEYQWGTTLWHELAHVITLEATEHRVPRWFSEGISVHEEWRSGPNPGVRIPLSVYSAINDRLFLPIADLDEGFIRPSYDGQVLVSYMQAGLACRFIERDFGIDRLRGLLRAFRDGQQTAAAIEGELGITPERFDDIFSDYVDTTYRPMAEHLGEWQRTQARISADANAANWTDVATQARRLLDMLPQYVETDSPYLALANAESVLGNESAALAALEAYFKNGGFDPESLHKLAAALDKAGRQDDAIAVLQSINMVDPLDQDLHGDLGDRLLASGRAAEALKEYEVALALDPHDKANAWYRVARAHYQLGDTVRTQESLLQALDIAPNFRPAQRLLLELASHQSE